MMFSNATGISASPFGAEASPGSYLTVNAADSHGNAAPSSAPQAPRVTSSSSRLQPYYQLPDSSGASSSAPPVGDAAGVGGAGLPWSSATHDPISPWSRPAASAAPLTSSANLATPQQQQQHPSLIGHDARPLFHAPPPLPSTAAPAPASGSPPLAKTRLVSPAIHAMAGSSPIPPPPPQQQQQMQLLSHRSPSPTSTMDYADIEQKQAELRGAVEYRIAHLETSLAAREEEVAALRGQLRRTEEDYQFNFNLIGERDAALEEASAQLQRLYRELKRVSSEASVMEKKLKSAEEDASSLRQASLDAEAEREKRVRQVERDFFEREKRLMARLEERDAAMKAEREELHSRYMALTRDVEKSRESVMDQHSVITEDVTSRQQQQQQRLETELKAVRGESGALQEAKRALEAELAATKARVSALEAEKALLEQHVRTVEQDAESTRALLERRLVETTEDRGRTSTAAEDALREQTRKLTALDVEKTVLQRRVTDLEARLQRDTAAHDDAQRRYVTQVEELRRSYNEAREALTTASDTHQETQQKTEAELQARTQALERSEAKLRDTQEAMRKADAHLTHAREEATRLSNEVSRLTEDVQRWKDEEGRTAAKARQEASAYETRVMDLERATRESKDSLDHQTRRAHDMQERLQNEVARITRELHASEAARRALEDQYHLSHDQSAQAALLQGLRMEKETLQARVMELERTNGEIQTQITNFTLELQNDPLVKSARDTQQRLVASQQELLDVRAENQRLQDAVKSKEEEAHRYQLALMRQAFALDEGHGEEEDTGDFMLYGGAQGRSAKRHGRHASPLSSSMQVWRQQQEEAFSNLRDTCESLRRSLKKEKRRRKRSLKRRGRSASESESESESESGEVHSSSAHRRSSGRQPSPQGGDRAARARHLAEVEDDGAMLDNTRGKEAHLLQESEVWRRKCLQLEQHLRLLLKERDQLQANLVRAKGALQSSDEEKRTLIDINAHLKSQLRDAYRTAYETQTQTASFHATRATPTPPPTSAGAAAASEVSPEVYAAVMSLLEKQQQQQQPITGRTNASAVDAVAAGLSTRVPIDSRNAAVAPRNASVRGALTGLNSSPERSSDPLARHGGAPGHGDDRLSILEDEIRHVKASISATRDTQQQRQREASTNPRGVATEHGAEVENVPVVRRGAAAVRHYGYA